MRGYQSTESVADRSTSLAAAGAPALLGCAAVGLLAGLMTAFIANLMDSAGLHLQLPGHKVLFWMPPLIIARLLLGHPIGATAGAGATAIACLGCGAHLAGGAAFTPLIVLAGSVLDAAAALAERKHLAAWLVIPLLGAAGAGAATLCAVKRLLAPLLKTHLLFGAIPDPAASVLIYAFFGLLAGLLGAAIAAATLRLRRKAG
jgi:hypothetical protein